MFLVSHYISYRYNPQLASLHPFLLSFWFVFCEMGSSGFSCLSVLSIYYQHRPFPRQPLLFSSTVFYGTFLESTLHAADRARLLKEKWGILLCSFHSWLMNMLHNKNIEHNAPPMGVLGTPALPDYIHELLVSASGLQITSRPKILTDLWRTQAKARLLSDDICFSPKPLLPPWTAVPLPHVAGMVAIVICPVETNPFQSSLSARKRYLKASTSHPQRLACTLIEQLD